MKLNMSFVAIMNKNWIELNTSFVAIVHKNWIAYLLALFEIFD